MKNKIKVFLVNISKKNSLLRLIVRNSFYFKNFLKAFRYYFQKIDNDLVLFESYMGRSYSCSPKAIYEELKKNQNYKFVWAFKNPSEYEYLKDERTILIKYRSAEYYKYFHKSKYIVTNSRTPEEVWKRKDQIYVQCWHGTPLKRLGFDIIASGKNSMNSKKDIEKKYTSEIKRVDYFLSPSKFATEKFKSAFQIKKDIILELGYPRNDELINYDSKKIEKLKKDLKIPENKKIIFYAPTWRDDQHISGVGYSYNLEINFSLLEENLKDDYVILYRPHYFVATGFDYSKYEGFVIDITNVSEMNDLYLISDILITDYSSVMFDYANLKRKMIFYMYDLGSYENEIRGFYIDLAELPGDIVKTTKEVIESIKDENYFVKYKERYSKFNEKYNYLDDGNASQRVVKKIWGD